MHCAVGYNGDLFQYDAEVRWPWSCVQLTIGNVAVRWAFPCARSQLAPRPFEVILRHMQRTAGTQGGSVALYPSRICDHHHAC